ncbi:MAG: hypothetical protein ABEI58_02090 [Candidatus Nanohaloarchaea archaeon]
MLNKILLNFKSFSIAATAFLNANLSDSPLRSLSYAALILTAGGSILWKAEMLLQG